MNRELRLATLWNFVKLIIWLGIAAFASFVTIRALEQRERGYSDVGVPSGFLDGIGYLIIAIFFTIIALILWSIGVANSIRKNRSSRTFVVVNRILQWLPIVTLSSFLGWIVAVIAMKL